MINEGVKTNEREKKKKKNLFVQNNMDVQFTKKKKTWTFKFTVLKNKLGKNKFFIEKKILN